MIEPRREKFGLRNFRPGQIRTELYSLGKRIEARNFEFKKKNDCTIRVAQTKAMISCAQKSGFPFVDQGLFSVPALVFDLAQLTSQKRFDGGYEIIEPSTTFLSASYGQLW